MVRAILSDAERVGWKRFLADPDPEVVGGYFTLADGEVDALGQLPTPATRLASAVALSAVTCWRTPRNVPAVAAARPDRVADKPVYLPPGS